MIKLSRSLHRAITTYQTGRSSCECGEECCDLRSFGGWPQLWQYTLGSSLPVCSALKLSPSPSPCQETTLFMEEDVWGLFSDFLPQATETGGILSGAGHQWEAGEATTTTEKEAVTMEISSISLWELERRSLLCVGSSCNRLSERSLW